MKNFSWLISKYILQATLPYFIFSWLLLSVVLFVQQAGRFSDIFFNLNVPSNLVWQLTLAIVPSVIAFTCPMAVLAGVIIGLSKMQGDSELVAIRAAGVGNLQIALPLIVLGIGLSGFAFFINLEGVPFASRIVRGVALKTALYKLESPIEPGVFNTEINGFTIYVKDGDPQKGTWRNIFIYQDDRANNQVRLITSRSGYIDATDENSELVLENAFINTVSSDKNGKLATENLGQIRLAIKTRRNEIVEKLSRTESTPEELGLKELAEYARNKSGQEKIEARVLWQRRILLSVTPLIFALLGTGLVIRYNRSGRGFGIFLALVALIVFYLISLLSEQLARTGFINVYIAGLLPLTISSAAIVWLFISDKYFLTKSKKGLLHGFKFRFPPGSDRISARRYYPDLTTGILDLDIIINLLKYFILTLLFLISIYLIFTTFELWKFAGTIPDGVSLLVSYLFYLLPFIYLQLAPSAIMIAILTTYVIKSRRNEIVTWTASGQSIYRLLLACFLLMAVAGVFNWAIQESIAPAANRVQDSLRNRIRSRGAVPVGKERYWVATDRRIYSFTGFQAKTPGTGRVANLTVYEFSEDGSRLNSIYRTQQAVWTGDLIKFEGETEQTNYLNDRTEVVTSASGELTEQTNPFNDLLEKPSHLNSAETAEQISGRESEVEKRTFEIALQKKYTTLILPLVIAMFTAPFALSLSRKGKAGTIGYAIGLWLLFLGLTNTFEQFGLNGSLSPEIAVWFPVFLFAVIGMLLLTRVKT